MEMNHELVEALVNAWNNAVKNKEDPYAAMKGINVAGCDWVTKNVVPPELWFSHPKLTTAGVMNYWEVHADSKAYLRKENEKKRQRECAQYGSGFGGGHHD